MFGTTRESLDYFGLKKLEELPPLAELKDGLPELSPQTDLIESLEAEARGELPPALIEGEALAAEPGIWPRRAEDGDDLDSPPISEELAAGLDDASSDDAIDKTDD